MMRTPVGRFRLIALIEGISFLVLLFIAMPLKYWADMPGAVSVVGAAHGGLFVLYILALVHAAFAHRWSLFAVIAAFVASLIPFATFVLDYRLRGSR